MNISANVTSPRDRFPIIFIFLQICVHYLFHPEAVSEAAAKETKLRLRLESGSVVMISKWTTCGERVSSVPVD
jgi:hypothetical protein